ncbi:MAG: exodeoxyribonuclease VII large subunit [Clostridiales bacterium]|nr:exodeoxyribonuclease VII large subunit [Eubacteriales bacterium]MDH7565230.1 exodeoxyribonuclease VII large subunit [Clostridiales bacterium]
MQYVLTVSQINKYLKELISKDLVLSNLWVKGEISNYKVHYSGHIYFTIKDEGGILRCVMFKSHASGLRFVPENGTKVTIKGYVSVFERDGQYQLYVEEMQPEGVGGLHLAFEQLKRKLKEEGLFDREHKKKIPFLPRSIGVVTSPTGAVIRDIIHVTGRRFGKIGIKVFAVAVQGEQAPLQIARAIQKLNEANCVDVIIVARGGGSLEELWAFNEEVVARSIYESRIPVISAVGHETDFTIADFVADVRAPTPSAAAELAVPDKAALVSRISDLHTRLRNSVMKNLDLKREKYRQLADSTVFKQPYNRLYQERMRVDVFSKYLFKEIRIKHERSGSRLSFLAGKLNALSPLAILSRGYSVAREKEKGSLVKSIRAVKPGDILEITVQDGRIDCLVQQTGEREFNEGE